MRPGNPRPVGECSREWGSTKGSSEVFRTVQKARDPGGQGLEVPGTCHHDRGLAGAPGSPLPPTPGPTEASLWEGSACEHRGPEGGQ